MNLHLRTPVAGVVLAMLCQFMAPSAAAFQGFDGGGDDDEHDHAQRGGASGRSSDLHEDFG